MLAYYKCTYLLSMWLPHIPTYKRRNGARFLLQVYRKDTSVCPNNLISISVTISILASWFVGAFDCRRVGSVGELDCRRVGLSVSCPVTLLITAAIPGQTDQLRRQMGRAKQTEYLSHLSRHGLRRPRRVGLSASWIVGELVCRRVGLSASCP